MTGAAATARRAGFVMNLGNAALMAMAIALPWELYQQIPYTGLTLVKCAGLLVILAGVLRAIALRRYIPTKLGIERPIATLAMLCAISVAFSLDRNASLRQIGIFTAYFVFVYASVYFVHDVASMRRLLHAYIVSSALLSCATLACYAGWLWPTFWSPADDPMQRLLLEYRDGVFMRMVAAGNDFNQAAMHILVAFVSSLFLYNASRLRMAARIALHLAQATMFAAMLISMSRSAVLIAALWTIVALARARRISIKQGLLLAGVAVAGALVFAYAFSGFMETFLHRAQGGLGHDDSSIRGRWQVYRIALTLVPQYALHGCGFGAVDAALAVSPFRDQAIMTVHSMPLRLLLELGVLGLCAYLWLWVQLLRRVAHWSRTSLPGTPSAALAVGAGALSVFMMTIVQPFPFLALYPFLILLCCGPAATPSPKGATQAAPSARFVLVPAAVCVVIIVLNCGAFQRAASQFERIVDAIDAGRRAELAAQPLAALEQYRLAARLAQECDPLSQSGVGLQRALIASRQELIRGLVDPEPVTLGLNVSWPDPPMEALAEYGVFRACLNTGNLSDARIAFDAMRARDSRFGFVAFDLAEALWAHGDYADALQQYFSAAAIPVRPLTQAELRHIRTVLNRSDRLTRYRHFTTADNHWRAALPGRLLAIDSRTDISAMLERAAILRRMGQWPEARAVYAAVLKREADNPEANRNISINVPLENK